MIQRLWCLLLATPLLSANVYEQIASQILETVPTTISTPAADELVSDDRLYFMLPNLSRHEQLAIASSILSDHAARSSDQSAYTATLPIDTARDLQLLTTHHKEENKTVLSRVARTRTLFGRLVLAKQLMQPTTDVFTLRRRQAVIAYFLENPSLAAQLRQLIEAFAEHEESFLSLWNHRDLLFGKNVRDAFYEGDLSAQHTAAELEKKRIFSDILLVASPFLYILLSRAIAAIGMDSSQIVSQLSRPLTDFLQRRFGIRVGDVLTPPDDAEREKITTLFSVLFTAIMFYSDGRRQLTKCLNRMDIVKHLRTRLSPLVRYARLTAMAGTLLTHEPGLAGLLPELEPLQDASSVQSEQEEFLENLRSNSFTSTSYFTKIGPVLAALPDFLKLRHTFGGTLEALGSLDAYLSIAQLYEEHRDTLGTFCFPEYAHASIPSLCITGAWHPLLAAQSAVTNDASFGTAAPSYLVLTGPNAAGKSTYLKTVVLNVLLGQTFGIMPAQQARFTPYQAIQTYLTIVDDIGNHKSLFKAEAVRAHQLLVTIDALPVGQHALIALDEMFCGTSPQVGQAMAYALTHLLRHHDNCTGLIATHFSKLTEIPSRHPTQYRNGHFKAFKQPRGSFYYPYKLHEGPSSQMIALDLLAHEGMDEKLLAYAYEQLGVLT